MLDDDENENMLDDDYVDKKLFNDVHLIIEWSTHKVYGLHFQSPMMIRLKRIKMQNLDTK